LARKLKYIDDETDVSEIIRAPFVFDRLDEEDVKDRLGRMHPDNMYVIHHSISHKDLKD